MIEIKEKFLPIGTVVLLKNATKRVMINGYATVDSSKPDKMFDYSGVIFPEGCFNSNQLLMFDHEQILRVDHVGLEDDEEKSFVEKLKNTLSQIKKGKIEW